MVFSTPGPHADVLERLWTVRIVRGLQRAQDTVGIAALHNNRDPLAKESSRPRFVSDAAMRRPTSLTRPSACSPQTPDISMANGTKSTPATMSEYFCVFLTSAAAAAEPAWMLLAWTYDVAYVLEQVSSQARDQPLFHGTCVTPSGRFPPL